MWLNHNGLDFFFLAAEFIQCYLAHLTYRWVLLWNVLPDMLRAPKPHPCPYFCRSYFPHLFFLDLA